MFSAILIVLCAVTCVALLTINASALARSRASSSGLRPDLVSTDQPASRNASPAEVGRESAMTMCTPDYNVPFAIIGRTIVVQTA